MTVTVWYRENIDQVIENVQSIKSIKDGVVQVVSVDDGIKVVDVIGIDATNAYWIYLEALRRSGVTDMYGAVPHLQEEFGLSRQKATDILLDWMKNYNRKDYEADE